MLYHFLYEFFYLRAVTGVADPSQISGFTKLLNVFQYVTFRTAYATITALLLCLIFGQPVIKWLRRLKFGQEIREEGPASHKEKQGTPTMGGILILGAVLISTLLWARLDQLYVWLAIVATGIFGAVGFLDDYIKIVKKRSLGLTGKQKLAGQLVAALIVFLALWISGDYSWNISIPFFKQTATTGITTVYPIIYLGLIIFVLLGSSNAVNLTDGLDGLATSITFIAMTALTALTYVASDRRWAEYLDLTHRPEAAELTVFCGAMVGASLGFLWFNAPPAEVFMGDVGSLAIGGAIGTIAVLTKNELMLPIVGGVFVIEALSVMLQVTVFQMTKRYGRDGKGRRIFAMAPIHHHFEVSEKFKWKESKIVFRFIIAAILFALLSLSTLKLR
jgi:phospho-N-acetylmuramoyl-pentapeptide-transferase